MQMTVRLNLNVFDSVQTRDESPISRLQQNPHQSGESPARVVVSSAYYPPSSLLSFLHFILTLPKPGH